MGDPPTSAAPSGTPSWSREGITIALSLIGAGASLNSWFAAFQALGIILIVAGLVVLVGAVWPSARSFAHDHLQTRSRRLVAGGVIVALLAGAALIGLRLSSNQSAAILLNSRPASEVMTQFSLLDLLPDERELPVDLVEKETNKRTGEALARLRSSGAEELMQRLVEWEFVENAYRLFGRAEGATPTPDSIYFLEVSIHRFGSTAGASGALVWFATDRSELAGLAPKPVEQIGDEARAIGGEQEESSGATNYREATIYARNGTILVRVTAQSKRANPMPVSIAVARLVVSKMPS